MIVRFWLLLLLNLFVFTSPSMALNFSPAAQAGGQLIYIALSPGEAYYVNKNKPPYLFIGGQPSDEACEIAKNSMDSLWCVVPKNAFWGEQDVSLANDKRGVAFAISNRPIKIMSNDGGYTLRLAKEPKNIPISANPINILPLNVKSPESTFSGSVYSPQEIKEYKFQTARVEELAHRLKINLYQRLGQDRQIWLTDSERINFQKVLPPGKLGLNNPLPIDVSTLIPSLTTNSLSFPLVPTKGIIFTKTQIADIISRSKSIGLPPKFEELLNKQLNLSNNLARTAVSLAPITLNIPETDIPSDYPDVCRYKIEEQQTVGTIVGNQYDFVDPTSIPGVMEAGPTPPTSSVINSSTYDLKTKKYILQGMISWKSIKPSVTVKDPSVYIIDTANDRTDDSYNNVYKNHGSLIATLIQQMSGISEASIKYRGACTKDGNGHCDMPKIISFVCEAALEASKNQNKVIINMSLGTPLPGEFLKTAVDYAVRKGALVVSSYGNPVRDSYCSPKGVKDFKAGDRCHQYPADWAFDLPSNVSPGSKGQLYSVGGFVIADNGQYDTKAKSRQPYSSAQTQRREYPDLSASVYAPPYYVFGGQVREGTSFSTAFVTGTLAAWVKNHPGQDRPTCIGEFSPNERVYLLNYDLVVNKNCGKLN